MKTLLALLACAGPVIAGDPFARALVEYRAEKANSSEIPNSSKAAEVRKRPFATPATTPATSARTADVLNTSSQGGTRTGRTIIPVAAERRGGITINCAG